MEWKRMEAVSPHRRLGGDTWRRRVWHLRRRPPDPFRPSGSATGRPSDHSSRTSCDPSLSWCICTTIKEDKGKDELKSKNVTMVGFQIMLQIKDFFHKPKKCRKFKQFINAGIGILTQYLLTSMRVFGFGHKMPPSRDGCIDRCNVGIS